MFQAVWHGAVLAESDQAVRVEGNYYFPPGSLRMEYFTPSQMTSVCPWKGTASYYDVTVDGSVNPNAAWYYPRPSPAARQIRDHVAFWNGVKVVRASSGDDGAAMTSGGGPTARLRAMFGR
jgi:uncharacterized protein (DUF427 family)